MGVFIAHKRLNSFCCGPKCWWQAVLPADNLLPSAAGTTLKQDDIGFDYLDTIPSHLLGPAHTHLPLGVGIPTHTDWMQTLKSSLIPTVVGQYLTTPSHKTSGNIYERINIFQN